MDYLDRAGLTEPLARIGFDLVGFGCTTCIGNSGPLLPGVSQAVRDNDLSVASVLSGNRNFEGRIHPDVRMNYLASPPLVVAYALAGTMDIDLTTDPLGNDADGQPVYLADLWPSPEEVTEAIRTSVTSDMFRQRYGSVFDGDERWQGGRDGHRGHLQLGSRLHLRPAPHLPGGPDHDARPGHRRDRGPGPGQARGQRDHRPHLAGRQHQPVHARRPLPGRPRCRTRRLQLLRDAAGEPRGDGAGNLRQCAVAQPAGPGNRGRVHPPPARRRARPPSTRPRCATRPRGSRWWCWPARSTGPGSSRDWAAKGTALLGIRAVIAESYERIHRSNLIGMGVLPLQYAEGQSAATLGLTGHEVFDHLRSRLAQRRVGAEDRRRRGPRTATAGWSSRSGCASTHRWRPSTTATAGSCPTCSVRWRAEGTARPYPARGRTNQAMTTKCSTAPTMVQAWNTSWYPKTPGTGSGRLRA